MVKKLAIVILYCLIFSKTFSQSVGNYVATRTTGISYSSIATSGNAVGYWRNNTGLFEQDDNRSQYIDIGFDFWYNGMRYTQVCISTNGFIDFSTSTNDGGHNPNGFGYNNSAFSASSDAQATRPALAVLYDNLCSAGAVTPLGNAIRYLVSGTAPNRIFTVEWMNMAVYTNNTPNLNFQVKLYETTGVIEYIYGTMSPGTNTFSYTMGINGPTVSPTPLVSELKNQITANTATFTNSPQNGLVTLPTSNSRIRFTPPAPLNPAGAIAFSLVTSTSMTLTWPNWATNEIGYLVWNSTDGVNYTFVTQTAANIVTTNILSLIPGTTYFWRVYAVTEGCLSSALTGSQATLFGINRVSNVAAGLWNNAGSWLPVGVPTAGDNVTILNGHNIVVNSDAQCNNLNIGQGASGILRIGNNGTVRTITVYNNITVNAGAQFITNTASDALHIINLVGNIVNNGTLNFATDANSLCRSNFNKNGNQSISGTGGVNNFNTMVLNLGTSNANSLNVTSANFSASANFLTLQNGTFNLASTAAVTINMFTASTALIGSSTGFTLNNANAIINMLGELDLRGKLRIDNGTLNIGNAANELLNSNGGEITINGGTLNVAGRYSSSNINTLSKFIMSNGTMKVATVSSSVATFSPFEISSAGSVVTISGGTIIIQREGGTGGQNLGFVISGVIGSSVTGGTLQIGNASTPTTQTMKISTILPVGNLLINSANATGQLTNDLTVLNDVTIQTGVLDGNNFILNVAGDWLDNGNFLPVTSTVIFDGTAVQTITDPTGERFYNVTCSSADTVRLLGNIDIDANLLIDAGSTLDAGSSNQTIDIQGNWTNNGNFYSRAGLVNFNGIVAQQITTATLDHFFDITIGNNAGVSIVSGTYEVEGSYTPNTGNFNVSASTSFTLLSDANRTARIGQATTGTVTGSMNIQRFINTRAAGYSDMASPVTTTTFADWNSELLLVYAYAPPDYYPSAYSYDEALWDYVPVTAATQTITPGVGFEVYLDSDGSYTSFVNTTVDSRGTPVIGNVNLSSAITMANDGWNLIGNPYASFISWDNLLAASTGINGDIMIYDEVALDFELISGGSAFEIAPHQGFWVQANTASPSLIFTENKKTSSSSSVFKSAQNFNFALKLESKDRVNFFTSKTQFVSNTNSTYERNISFRSIPHPLAPKLFSVANSSEKLRLQKLDFEKEELIIQLGFIVGEDGKYSISSSNLSSIIENGYTCILLHDSKTGAIKQLTELNSYVFYATSADDINRFTLQLIKSGKCGDSNLLSSNVGFIDGKNEVTVNLTSEEIQNNQGTINVYNLLGEKVGTGVQLSNATTYSIKLPETIGCYLISVLLNGQNVVHKFINR